jgi:hypothetical protein
MFRSRPISKTLTRLKHALIATTFVGSQLIPFMAMGVASAATVSSTVSSTGFVLTGDYSVVAGQPTGIGKFKNGNVGAYPEGACIPAVFQVTNSSNTTGDLVVTPVFDYLKSGAKDEGFTNLETVTSSLNDATSATNLNQLTYPGTPLSSATSFKTTAGNTVTATVSGPYAGNDTTTTVVSTSDTFRHYNVTLQNVPKNVTVNVLTCGRLGLDASEYNGSSLSLRTVQGGQENVPIPVNQILVLPSITINKSVTQGSALPSDFSFSVSPSVNGTSTYAIPVGQTSVTIPNVNPDGNYVITESGPSGYKFTGGTGTSCVVGQASIGTAAGQMTATVAAGKPASNATCNFTNTVNTGSITIVKDGIPNSLQDFSFTTSNLTPSSFILDDDNGVTGADNTHSNTQTFSNLVPGTYGITESATSGWDFDNVACTGTTVTKNGATVSVALTAGQNATCTYTNRQRAHLVVNKVTTPANDPTGFSITASGTPLISGATAINGNATQTVTTSQSVTYDVAQGTYSVNEQVPTGWSQASNTCSNVVINGTTALVNGVPTASCTITNTKLAKITIAKQTNPSSSSQAFSFTPSANLSGSNFSLDTDSTTATPSSSSFANLTPGQTYTVTENAQSGWQLTNLTCSGVAYTWDGKTSTLSLTPIAGADITCTYTNTQLGSISGTKYEVDAGATTGGTKKLAGWVICLDANNNDVCDPAEASNAKTTDANGNYSFDGLLPGIYGLFEQLQTGWTQIFTPSDVNLSAGQTSTGNNFGNFENGSISGVKFNDHNGDGTKDTSDENLSGWTVNLEDANNTILQTQVTDGTGYSFTNLAPGTYKVCEVGQTGWVQTYPGGDGCHTTVIDQSGETNTDDFGNQGRGTITVSKNLDDGFGNLTKDVTGWTWNYDGTYGRADNIAAGTSSVASVPAGSYTISENNQSDYHFASLVCSTAASIGGATYTLTVTPGAKVTCTYTNVRDTGTLVIKKNVINDNGGTKTYADFSFAVDGGSAQSFDADSNDANNQDGIKTLTVTTGNYSVAEPEADTMGYVTGYDNCSNAAVTADQTTVCTITNNDVAPKLTLVKIVTNDNGGTAKPTDFILGATPSDDHEPSLGGAGGASGTIKANEAYSLSESNLPGYTPSAWFCSVGATMNGTSITLAPGADVTCTITNDDVAPLITVTKTVTNNNGGILQVSDFPLYVGNIQVTSGTQAQISQAGTYLVTELGNSAYQATAWSGDCDAFGNIIMVVGGVYNCSITNDDIAPQLTVIKHVVNTNTNRTDTADDFTMNVTGTNVSSPSFPGHENGTTVTLNAGDYNVTEDANSNYTATYSADCDSSMQIGEHKTCTVTNTAKLVPRIHVVKSASTDNAYVGDTVTYTFTVTNTGNTPLSVDEVNDNVAGDGNLVSGDTNSNNLLDVGETWLYTVDYTVPANSGDDVHNTVTVCGSDVEETQVCDHSDHHLHVYHPTISVTKYVYTDADSDDGTFHLNIDGHTYATGGDGTTTDDIEVLHGTHTVAETGANGTDLSDYDSAIACYVGGDYIGTSQENPSGLGTSLDDVAVQQDQHADCYIYNQRHAHLTVIKDAVPNDPQPFNFTLEKYTPCYDFGIELFSNLTQIDEQCNDYTSVDNFQLVDNTDPALAMKTESLSAGNIWQEQDSTTYRLSEAATAGWDLTGIDCGDVETNVVDGNVTLVLHSGQNVTCTYTNTKRASLTIAKDAQPNSLQMFNFTSDIDGANSFSLMDDGTANANSKTMTNLLPGTYTVTEAASDNWSLNGVSCGDGVTMKLDGHTLTVTLAPGANVTCTFTNAQGAVLGAVTTPLVNTGNSIWVNVLVGLTALLTTLGLAVATRRSAKS